MDIEEESPPGWVKSLFKKMDYVVEKVDSLEVAITSLKLDVAEQKERVEAIADKVEVNELGVGTLKAQVEDLQGENVKIKIELNRARELIDEQIDRSLRDQLTFYGVKRGEDERSWSDTTTVLCEWLAKNTDKTADYYDKNIDRCHRGAFNPEKHGPRPIHWWRVAEEIRDSLGKKYTDGVRITDKFSANTQARLNDALMFRKKLREQNTAFKIYVAYPARVMVKRPSSPGYKLEKSF